MGPRSLVSLHYELDADNRIVAVSDGWDWFATANGAPELTSEAVIGQPLDAFIAGRELQQLTVHLLSSLRQRPRNLQLPFRCDSPQFQRHLTMSFEALPHHRLRISTVTLREQVRPAVRPTVADPDEAAETLTLCAWCNRYALPDGGWAELERVLAGARWYVDRRPPLLSHGLCDTCHRLLSRAAD